MREKTLLREDNWQSPLCSKPEPMFMNDKQSKLVRSSTAQCKDLPEQKLTRDLTTSVDNCPCSSIAGIYIYFIRRSKPIQSVQWVTICQDSTHLPLEPYV